MSCICVLVGFVALHLCLCCICMFVLGMGSALFFLFISLASSDLSTSLCVMFIQRMKYQPMAQCGVERKPCTSQPDALVTEPLRQ